MKAVIQRVSSASVTVDEQVVGRIETGILILTGVENGDTAEKAEWLARKISELRIFNDGEGKMNLSVMDVKGAVLVISQFTLAGNCNKGRRPSFDTAAPPDEGKRLYDYFVLCLKKIGLTVETGIFQADLKVSLLNDGPVTFILER